MTDRGAINCSLWLMASVNEISWTLLWLLLTTSTAVCSASARCFCPRSRAGRAPHFRNAVWHVSLLCRWTWRLNQSLHRSNWDMPHAGFWSCSKNATFDRGAKQTSSGMNILNVAARYPSSAKFCFASIADCAGGEHVEKLSAICLCKFAILNRFQNGHFEMLAPPTTIKKHRPFFQVYSVTFFKLQFVGPWGKKCSWGL